MPANAGDRCPLDGHWKCSTCFTYHGAFYVDDDLDDEHTTGLGTYNFEQFQDALQDAVGDQENIFQRQQDELTIGLVEDHLETIRPYEVHQPFQAVSERIGSLPRVETASEPHLRSHGHGSRIDRFQGLKSHEFTEDVADGDNDEISFAATMSRDQDLFSDVQGSANMWHRNKRFSSKEEAFGSLPSKAAVRLQENSEAASTSKSSVKPKNLEVWSEPTQPSATQPTTMGPENDAQNLPESPNGPSYAESMQSDGSVFDLHDSKKVELVEWFVGYLSNELEDIQISTSQQDEVASLLLTYQRGLRLHASSGLERMFTKFVRHRRNMVANMLISEHGDPRGSESEVDWQNRIDMLWPTLLFLPMQNLHMPAAQPDDIDLTNIAEEETGYHVESSELVFAKRFLFNNPHYSWLISRLRCELTLLPTGNTSSAVRNELTRCLGSSGDLSIKLHWDPVDFLQDQYGSQKDSRLADVVCLVGSETCAFATSCVSYLELMWPTLGSRLLQFLDSWISSGASAQNSSMSPLR